MRVRRNRNDMFHRARPSVECFVELVIAGNNIADIERLDMAMRNRMKDTPGACSPLRKVLSLTPRDFLSRRGLRLRYRSGYREMASGVSWQFNLHGTE